MFNHGYNSALVRGLAHSFTDAPVLHPPPSPVCMATAHAQHQLYVELLALILGPRRSFILSVDADEACPDCVFIEDAILALPGSLIGQKDSLFITTRPGAPERRAEVSPVREAVLSINSHTHQGVVVKDLPEHRGGEPCFLDGGDVLYDGRTLWVGITARTNRAAVNALRDLLPSMTVLPVPVLDSSGTTLHLKSLVSAIDTGHVLMADNEAGRMLLDAMRRSWEEERGSREALDLRVTFVPDQLCSNVLRVNGHVVMQVGYPASQSILEKLCADLGLTLHTLNMSELAKADGALTCCCVLFNKGSE